MTGNCLKGSRPLLFFDKGFDQTPAMKVAKELLQQCFNVPRGHHKSKPFIDHVMGFYLIDGRIWMRNFQISHMRESASPEPVLAEIGVLHPCIFTSSSRPPPPFTQHARTCGARF